MTKLTHPHSGTATRPRTAGESAALVLAATAAIPALVRLRRPRA